MDCTLNNLFNRPFANAYYFCQMLLDIGKTYLVCSIHYSVLSGCVWSLHSYTFGQNKALNALFFELIDPYKLQSDP